MLPKHRKWPQENPTAMIDYKISIPQPPVRRSLQSGGGTILELLSYPINIIGIIIFDWQNKQI